MKAITAWSESSQELGLRRGPQKNARRKSASLSLAPTAAFVPSARGAVDALSDSDEYSGDENENQPAPERIPVRTCSHTSVRRTDPISWIDHERSGNRF